MLGLTEFELHLWTEQAHVMTARRQLRAFEASAYGMADKEGRQRIAEAWREQAYPPATPEEVEERKEKAKAEQEANRKEIVALSRRLTAQPTKTPKRGKK